MKHLSNTLDHAEMLRSTVTLLIQHFFHRRTQSQNPNGKIYQVMMQMTIKYVHLHNQQFSLK